MDGFGKARVMRHDRPMLVAHVNNEPLLDHSTHNPVSCSVATKSGYLLEDTKRSAAVHDDGRHDMHLHACVRGD
ncbi:hypothetical protein GCM10010372_83420 [Streptomyces tauricus]|nr:hypothetical protein GCM10010372_83420 [Streptomyces tauricus]